MTKYTQSTELYHYGVPGMKWGKRKGKSARKSNKRREKDPLEKQAQDAKRYKAVKVGAAVAGGIIVARGAVKVAALASAAAAVQKNFRF